MLGSPSYPFHLVIAATYNLLFINRLPVKLLATYCTSVTANMNLIGERFLGIVIVTFGIVCSVTGA